jgi:hypothetical protein
MICDICKLTCKSDTKKKDCKEFEMKDWIYCKGNKVSVKICLGSHRFGCGTCKIGKEVRKYGSEIEG